MNRSMWGFKFGDQGGRRTQADTFLFQNDAKRGAELAVVIHQHITLPVEKSIFCVGEVPANLFHPPLVWVGRTASEVNATRLKLHDEQ